MRIEMSDLKEKERTLTQILNQAPRLMIAYSGGVDSAVLLWFAVHRSHTEALGVIADSPSLKRSELHEAIQFATSHQLPLQIVQTNELNNPEYQANPLNRCYFCKHELFSKMESLAQESKYPVLAYGENLDDIGDHRPGRQAALDFKVIAPLKEAGLTKSDIRHLARRENLEVAEKVAQPCLASRLPTGVMVDHDKLQRVEQAEEFLAALGFQIIRVRHFEEKAKVLVSDKEVSRLHEIETAERIINKLLELGFAEVELSKDPYQGPSVAV